MILNERNQFSQTRNQQNIIKRKKEKAPPLIFMNNTNKKIKANRLSEEMTQEESIDQLEFTIVTHRN
jgi:hypothetical protein